MWITYTKNTELYTLNGEFYIMWLDLNFFLKYQMKILELKSLITKNLNLLEKFNNRSEKDK